MNTYKAGFRSLIVAGLLLTGTSCSDYFDVNTSPNLAASAPANLLLTSAEGMLGFTMGSDVHRYTLLFSQQLAAQNGRQTEAWDAYNLQSTEVNGLFRTNLYAGVMADLEQILAKDPQVTHPAFFGIAKTLKAFTYSVITDLWGDVPFSQALQGTTNTQPKLDPSRDIYTGLIRLLDEAIVDLGKTSSLAAPTTADYVYAGNTQRWIRLANTLKLRLYLHMLNAGAVTPEFVNAFVRTTEANAQTGFMTGVADDFQQRFEATANRQNPIHQFILTRTDDIAVSATIMNLMNSKADPRRAVYFTPAPFSPAALATPPASTTGYIGLQNGTGGNQVRNTLSRLHTYVRGNVTTPAASVPAGPTLGVTGLAYDGTAPVQMLNFAEYNFIRAELALRYGGPGDAQTFFQRGITASFTDAGLGAQAAAYITRNGTLTGSPEQQLQQIIEEKYVGNFMVALEPWNDWRRTGYPGLSRIPTSVNPGNQGRVPRALPYPQQEVDANPNISQRNSLSERPVFWDTRTTGPQ
ncbi:SusD/RagB family nutrient-binding outer membrane lipoprotein [Spirosoma sordidisoli]|uniref:SusD/RagB family nutrient-binding outer membrane lipoprotein n=1 Tax=Spirosoma sordidisoli TaxID=2502893 RepID=A0A4V1RWW0_9BACT|nr:SusD/RagB family nutrient-binding outer membrane lipoprotein [Spirosoma sordidisoli]RYC71638.1 SusD/RagB family nutrient-binding outer membrane lipoprotein [Spirosoma sordidisoli]